MMNKDAESIVFPHEWEFRAFCESGKVSAAEEEFRKIAEGEKMPLQMQYGEASKSGTYRTIRVTTVVASREQAESFGTRLKGVDGIKFIL